MSRTRIAALVLLVVISMPIGIVLLRPALVLSTLANPALTELGFKISELEVLHLGINSTAIDRLVLSSEDQSIVLSRIHAQYSLSQLLAATAQSVSIDKIELQSRSSSAAPSDEASATLASLLESFDAVPVHDLYLPNIELTDTELSYKIGMGLQSPPLHMVGDADFKAIANTLIEFDILRKDPKILTVVTKAAVDGALITESEIELGIGNDFVEVAATSSLVIEPLQEQFVALLPAQTKILNEELRLQSNFEVRDILGEPALSKLSLVIESSNSQLQLSQESDLGGSSLQLRLPISIQGDISIATGELQLTLSDIFASGDWSLSDATAQSEHNFEETQLHCTSFTSCDIRSLWLSNVSNWQYGEYLGENTSVTAPLRFNYSNDEMRLTADTALINIPSVTSSTESAFSEVSTSLQIDELEFRVGAVISGGFNFSSSEFRVENKIARLSAPTYSGKLELEEDILTGILELDLDQSLRLGVGLQHFFLRDTGDVVLQLAAHEFSEAKPLSSLITPLEVDADIVAGEIEGLANISWSKQLDNTWRFGGPVALKIDGLSGYYAEYLFVDLNTDLFAEATTPLGIQVSNPASASLSRVDIGLPLEDLSWQYRFDSITSSIEIIEFNTALLGGELSVPFARYNPKRDRQQIDVVLADLEVESLVGLAEYPGVQADGLISGYLPFIIEGENISIEKGLVGALHPGGTIRYSPTNPEKSSNQSMQLVNDALSNYQYQTMNTEVFYDEAGELLLNVQLHGSNPDMNDGQEINLNVNITDNIPSLLKSLQASRVITDELERFVR